MAQPNTPLLLSEKSQEALIHYQHQCVGFTETQWNLRGRLRKIDLTYAREKDLTQEHAKAKVSNAYGDANKFQNITVPVVLPQVESAVTYQASVFLTGTPIFGVAASPEFIDQAVQMETVLSDESTRGGWVGQFEMFFRDLFKYNIAGVEVEWCRKVTPVFETSLSFQDGKQGKPNEVIWEGNAIRRLDMYNTFYDSRVVPSRVHEDGEFAGYIEVMSRIKLKQFISSLPTKFIENIIPAFESGLGSPTNDGQESYFIPEINPESTLNRNPKASGINWLSWAGIAGAEQKIQYKDVYEVTTLYARILPADFGIRVPGVNTPQVWKFITVNAKVLIHAERMTNAHNFLPMIFAQSNEDGLNLQTKSLATNVEPMQAITSAMWNSIIAARRRAISDRGLYDPSRVSERHINSDNPSAKIPVRPAAYGKPLGEAYYPIPFRDDQSAILLQETGQVIQMADMVSGRNQIRQGQFVKGNKTRKEFETVMGNANGRDQLVSLHLESQFFTPIKEILKINILQYQGGTSLYNKEQNKVITIDPVALRKAIMEFKISDGLLPTDKIISSDTLQIGIQVIGSSPQIGAGYNIAPMFSYLMKTQGANISAFEKSPEQQAYEQALGQWQQAMAQVAESLKKFEGDPATIQFPPQPLPEQYGYKPGPVNTPQGTSQGSRTQSQQPAQPAQGTPDGN